MVVSFFMLVMSSGYSQARDNDDNSFCPPDSAFTMQVERYDRNIWITVVFKEGFTADVIFIERKAEFDQAYSQCKYIKFDEINKSTRKMVQKDTYPHPATVDVMYRLKIIDHQGGVHMYPGVMLPALNQQ